MKKNNIYILLMLLSLLLSNVASGATAQVNNIIQWGGVENTSTLTIPESNSDGYFAVYGGGTLTAGNFAPLYKNGTAYQVTGGTTFKAVKICVVADSSVQKVQIVSDTDAITQNDSALTAGVFQFGATGVYGLLTGSGGSNNWQCYSSSFSIAASRYAGYQGAGAVGYGVIVIGKES